MFENGESFDNGLFIAFAPFDNPQIVICVVGEGARPRRYVAPIVRDMLDVVLCRQVGTAPPPVGGEHPDSIKQL